MSNLLDKRMYGSPHFGQYFLAGFLRFRLFNISRKVRSFSKSCSPQIYWSSIFCSGKPNRMRNVLTLSRWSPWRIIWLFLAVPPHAQKFLSFCASWPRFWSLSFIPSTIVAGFPHLRLSRRIFIRCCSLLISPHTHMSFGSPQVGQISAMLLK